MSSSITQSRRLEKKHWNLHLTIYIFIFFSATCFTCPPNLSFNRFSPIEEYFWEQNCSLLPKPAVRSWFFLCLRIPTVSKFWKKNLVLADHLFQVHKSPELRCWTLPSEGQPKALYLSNTNQKENQWFLYLGWILGCPKGLKNITYFIYHNVVTVFSGKAVTWLLPSSSQ